MSFSRECAKVVQDKWDRYQMHRIYKRKRNEVYNEVVENKWRQQGILSDYQKKAVDTFYLTNYGERVDYGWHEFYTAVNEKFEKMYLPKPLYFAEFERFENLDKHFISVLEDKNFLPLVAKGIGVHIPRMLLNCTCGIYRDENNGFISRTEVERYLNKCGEVVIKPSVGSCGEKNIVLACFKDGADQYSGNSLKNILDKYGDNFVVQERLRSHESLRKIYPESINNFRVVSYRWRDEIRICPAYLRVGQGGSFVDNISSGGFAVGIDDTGTFVGPAFSDVFEKHFLHPDTGVAFKNYVVSRFVAVVEAVRLIHENISEIGCCNWDFTIGEDGEPVLIEANLVNGGGCGMAQITHGGPVFAEHTAEILRWLRVMKRTPLSKRKQYMFGYGID